MNQIEREAFLACVDKNFPAPTPPTGTAPSAVRERARLLSIMGKFFEAGAEWQARSALAQSERVPEVRITGHLDEVDAPVWEFINAEARKLGPITGSIDCYGLSRPNGAQPNGGVVVLWNGQKIHAVALAVRDAMNRTQCVLLLASAPSPSKQGGE